MERAQQGRSACAGDQADEKLLDEILTDSKDFSGYDVIIDDGGHTVNQMLTSIKVMPADAAFPFFVCLRTCCMTTMGSQ